MFKKAILMIHGFAGAISDIEYLANNLELFWQFDVYNFTLAGHNDGIKIKSKKEEWIKSAEAQVEWLVDNGYKTVYVVGHSMGGVIACHLAKKYSVVKKLVLLAPAFKYFQFKGDNLSIINSIKKAPDILKGYPKDKIFARFLQIPIPTLLSFFDLIKEHYNDPKKIKIPILIIHGDKDKVVPIDSSIYVHNTVNSRINVLVKISGVNHQVLDNTRKDEICDLTKTFLKNNLKTNYKQIIEM